MTMIARGRMLRDSYRIISARGNYKVLTESDFCLLPCTPNVRFLAGITSIFIYNVGAQRSRQFVIFPSLYYINQLSIVCGVNKVSGVFGRRIS